MQTTETSPSEPEPRARRRRWLIGALQLPALRHLPSDSAPFSAKPPPCAPSSSEPPPSPSPPSRPSPRSPIIPAVICQPDRPAGRGLEQKPSPVKARALELGLHVEQPVKVRTPEFAAWIRDQNADVALVIAYGRILTPAVLQGPRRGCVNLHASLLPKYRGAAPITWAIVRGEAETGISVMQMDEGMDTGPVFTRTAIPIGPEMTADELEVALGQLAAELVGRDLPRIVGGELTAVPQDNDAATLAPILEKENGRIDFAQGARAVHDHVRGMTPWPGAFTTVEGRRSRSSRAG